MSDNPRDLREATSCSRGTEFDSAGCVIIYGDSFIYYGEAYYK